MAAAREGATVIPGERELGPVTVIFKFVNPLVALGRSISEAGLHRRHVAGAGGENRHRAESLGTGSRSRCDGSATAPMRSADDGGTMSEHLERAVKTALWYIDAT